uniref:Major facilitator superfamily (MFS) profile domain-containing protein n=1 Tax=Amphimedon queenslandica TaxID=400682 RepID=A0A1X7U9B5_AMPQE
MARIWSKFSKWYLISSSALLVLIWDYLIYWNYFLIGHFGGNYFSEGFASGSWSKYGFYMISCLGNLFFPFFGLLTDAWIGRGNAVMIGAMFCLSSWITAATGLVIHSYLYQSVHFLWFTLAAGTFLEYIGYTSFRANIIQYNIDQLVGASDIDYNTVIFWHAASVQLTALIYYPLQCIFLDDSRYFITTIFIVSGISVSLVLVSHSLFRHKLEENMSLMKNPIKLVVRVLCYARKHKYPENRSALTYWEEEAPSRLDLGKEKYGGPFTEEEVEDVRTALRMLPLFIAVFAFALSDDYNWYISKDSIKLISCLIPTDFGHNACSVILLLAYLYLIRVFFYKYIPNMLSRMSAGLLFALATSVSKLIIFSFKTLTNLAHNNLILIVPQILYSVSFILLYPVSLEFTVAQSPVHMRGVMVGMWYAASVGLGYLLNIVLQFPFNCENEYICTNVYYYTTKSAIVLLILIVFVILAKRYKYRVRENEVNIVQIVDDHYQRYMQQEEKYHKNLN